MSELVTYCKRHDVAVYPDAGKKYLVEFHERHKDCGRQVMSESFTRQQVDAITAPWLALCKEQEETIEELKAELKDEYNRSEDSLVKLEARIDSLKAENVALLKRGDKWKEKNNAAVGLVNKLGERAKRKEAELAALREAVKALPIEEEMTYDQDGELVLAGYCMQAQAQGEWVAVKALLEASDE